MKLVRNHGVTAPAGFRAAAVSGSDSAVRREGPAVGGSDAAALDVAVLVNEGPDLVAAGIFAGREDKAAAVLWTQQVITTGRLRAVLLHSDSTDSTSDGSVSDAFGVAHRCAEQLAGTLSGWGTETGAIEVAVCTTRSAGARPAVEPLLLAVAEAVHELAGGITGGEAAARTVAGRRGVLAQAALEHEDGWTVGGMADGPGAVCVLTTDAVATAATLNEVLETTIKDQLPSSANTAVLLLASGASEMSGGPQALAAAVAGVYQDLRIQAGAEGLGESA